MNGALPPSSGRAVPALAAATRVWRDFSPKEEVYEFGLKGMRQGWAEAGS
jgi:D-psicose/D-tagatose/L-ribulose 3-epimerase